MGHVVMENRNGLVVDTATTTATGTAEREAAITMIENLPGRPSVSRRALTRPMTHSTLSPRCADWA